MFIKFEGASVHEGDHGKEYTPRGPIAIQKEAIMAYYDHTILIPSDYKIRVMEDFTQISKKMREV